MRFVVCDLQTGKVLDEAPFSIGQDPTRRLMSYGTGALSLPILSEFCPPTWRETIVPWRCLIVLCDDDETIMWAGVPDNRQRTAAPIVEYTLVTLEKYFDRRYMPDAAFAQVDQIDIASDIVSWVADGVTGIGLDIDAQPSRVRRDREYFDDEDARILTRLQQLAAVENGFEWTIEVEWGDDDHSFVRKVFRTGYPNLGYVTTDPEHIFTAENLVPGAVTDFTFKESWSEGDAATYVQAAGDGQGETKPMSTPVIDSARESAGWPRLEERRTQSGVIEQNTLDAHADGMAATMFGGQQVIEIDCQIDRSPTPSEVTLGDSVRIEINTEQLQLDGVFRVIGWSVSPGGRTWRPVLARLGEDYTDAD